MKTLKKMFDWLCLFMGAKNDLTDEMVDAGVLDLSGQGRDKYGR